MNLQSKRGVIIGIAFVLLIIALFVGYWSYTQYVYEQEMERNSFENIQKYWGVPVPCPGNPEKDCYIQ